jgi:hypothetical protein
MDHKISRRETKKEKQLDHNSADVHTRFGYFGKIRTEKY